MTEASVNIRKPGPTSGNAAAALPAPKESTGEWSQLATDSGYLNSDLFGGDLFGDELMDMYSSAVVEGSDPDIAKSSKAEGDDKDVSSMNEEPLGFGALRQSPSLNDFSSLFPSAMDHGGLAASLDVNAPMDPATAAALQVAGVPNTTIPLNASEEGSGGAVATNNPDSVHSGANTQAPISHPTQGNSFVMNSSQTQPQAVSVASVGAGSADNSTARKRKDAPAQTQQTAPMVASNTSVVNNAPLPLSQPRGTTGAVIKKAEGGVTTSVITERMGRAGGVFHQVKAVTKPSVPQVKRQRKNSAATKKASAVSRKAAHAKAVAQFAPLAASQVSKITKRNSHNSVPAAGAQAAKSVANPLCNGSGNEDATMKADLPVSGPAEAVRPSSPSNLASKETSPALVSPGSHQGANVTITAPSTLSSSAQDINAAVAAVALAKANALLSNAKNAAAHSSSSQHSGPTVPSLPVFASLSKDGAKNGPAGTTKCVTSASVLTMAATTATPCPVVSSNVLEHSAKTDKITAPLEAVTTNNLATSGNVPPVQAAEASTDSDSLLDSASQAKRRVALTPEDRAKQNRDRNREHARNTRLRKKAYVEELKKTLTEIVAQRDALQMEKETEKQRESECRSVRVTVMEEFLKLRGSNIRDASRWEAILEDSFYLTLPKTSYRKMVSPLPLPNVPISRNAPSLTAAVTSGVPSVPLSVCVDRPTSFFGQTIKGVNKNMEDASLLSEMLAGFGRSASGMQHVSLTYECHKNRFMMDSSNHTAVLDWTARTVGAKAQGASYELAVTGNMRALFHPATNKLLSVELSFDTSAVSSQLQSMYSSSFYDCSQHSDADATAALLDSLNVPQLEGLIASTAESVNSSHHVSVSSDEHNESDCCSEGAYMEEKGVARKKSVQVL